MGHSKISVALSVLSAIALIAGVILIAGGHDYHPPTDTGGGALAGGALVALAVLAHSGRKT